jgi:hypothetical protein
MLVTPGQQLSQQQLANTLASAPDPTMAAQADLAALAAGTKAGGAAGGAPGAGAPTTTTPGAAPNPDGFGAYTGGWLTGTNTSPYGAAGTIPGSTTTTTPGTTIGSEDWLNQFYDSGNVTPGAQYPTEVGPGITDTGVTGQQYTGEIGPGLNMGETGTGTDYFDTSQLFDEYGNYIGG